MNFERRCWAEVDLNALRHNFHIIRKAVKEAEIMAVVKADAYGHGDLAVAALLEREGAAAFAVSGFEEAMRLRRTGIRVPVLVLGYTGPQNAAALSRFHITQTVFSAQYAQQLSQHACAAGVTVEVHCKLDTGMGRLGFSAIDDLSKAVQEIEQVCALPGLCAQGIFTHFANADSCLPADRSYTLHQYQLFRTAIAQLKQRGLCFPVHHCCNSAAICCLPHAHGTLVRPGILLYGHSPSADVQLNGLIPAMRLKATVAMVKWVRTGDSISYGGTFTAPHPIKLATLTIGYADGYPRILSGQGIVSIHGRPAAIVGRICMDQMMVDVTAIDNVCAGDEAVIFGDEAAHSIVQIAAAENSIHYEVLCDIGRRVQRVYTENGQEVNMINYLREGSDEAL